MLLNVVFEGTVFVKFKISNTCKFKQKIDETHSKTTKTPYENLHQRMDFKNIKKKIREPMSRDFCQKFVISKKKTIP